MADLSGHTVENGARTVPLPTRRYTTELFTKILSKQLFEKHRKTVLNTSGDTGAEHARRTRFAARGASSQRDGTGTP